MVCIISRFFILLFNKQNVFLTLYPRVCLTL
jgi:hypothetical protein